MRGPVRRFLVVGAGLAATAAVGWWLSGLYSVPSPWDEFELPAREFLEAAAGRDSARLRQLVVSPAVVASALRSVAEDSASFSTLGPLVLTKGRRTGDTTRVVFLN